MKRSLIAIAAATALGVTALGTTLTLAHSDGVAGPGGRAGMMGPAMMGGGYGPGAGMMGAGMGPAMMGYGQGNANTPCPGYTNANAEPLSLEDAQTAVQQRLTWMGNDRLKMGKVEAKGDSAYTAEIVTKDNSLVETVEIDRKTGFIRPVR